MNSLFEQAPEPDDAKRPLAERMRPRTLEEFMGQQHVLGSGKPLRAQIERDELQSLILWAWVLTLPLSAVVGWCSMEALQLFPAAR